MKKIAVDTLSGACKLTVLSIISFGVSAQTADQIEIVRATVVYVSGQELVVKTDDGQVKLFTVPSHQKFTVDGRLLGVSELKPGTKLTQTITSTTEERTITKVRNVDAEIIEVKPPNLTFSSGNTTTYTKVPAGTTFTINGKPMQLSDLKPGMRVKGTVVTSTPTSVVTRARSVTGTSPPPPVIDTPVFIGVLLIEESR